MKKRSKLERLEATVIESESIVKDYVSMTIVKTTRLGDNRTFFIKGQHRIDSGEHLSALYKERGKENWISEYAIRDEAGRKKYSCVIRGEEQD